MRAVRLAPDVIEALIELRKVHQPLADGWILPHRTLGGTVDANRRMSTPQFEIHWNAIQEKNALPKLRPKDLRHWVSTACRKAGMTKQASNYLQGHDAQTGQNMRDAYDQPPLEEWLDE
jgi:integrase